MNQEKAMDDLMAHPCPVCGKRFGDHKTVYAWIGEGCPDAHEPGKGYLVIGSPSSDETEHE